MTVAAYCSDLIRMGFSAIEVSARLATAPDNAG